MPALPLWSGTTGGWVTIGGLHEPDEATEWAGWEVPRTEQADQDAVLAKLFDGTRRVPLDLDPAGSGRAGLLRDVGRLWTRGVAVDWVAFHAGGRRNRVPLPTYPFERKRYWMQPLARADAEVPASPSVAESLRVRFDASDGQRKAELVLDFIRGEVASMLGLGGPQLVDPRQDLFGLGFDSLDLIDLAAKLGAELDMDMPVSLFGEHPTIRTYVDNLAESSGWFLTRSRSVLPNAVQPQR